jgi:hypothetical protein
MKYMLMIYEHAGSREAALADGKVMAEVKAIMDELTQTGELLGGQALADPSQTLTVQVADGVPVVTDGPFIESKEHLGGYVIIETETAERAVEIAARWPTGETPMELRPIMDGTGEEM